ncbi:MAG: hypothetical protein ACQES5_11680 [Thermodesulfobacteriota bacterium]
MGFNILIIMLIFLFFAVMVAFSARHLNTSKERRIQLIQEKQKNIQTEFDEIKHGLVELTAQKNELQQRITDLKADKLANSSSEEETADISRTSAVDVLQKKELVSDDQLQKAKHYLSNNEANMKEEDVLVMFGFISPEQLKQAREEAQG